MKSARTPAHDSPEALERALGRVPTRVLLAGPRAASRAPAWAATGAQVCTALSGEALSSAHGPWDVVVLDGALESERWDRWLVQRLHRQLVPGGVLVVSTPNLLDVWSLAGQGYVASRIVRQLRRRLRPRGAIPQADRSAFAGRRYTPGPLASMIRDVGFEVLSVHTTGHGLPGPIANAMGGLGRRTAQRVGLVARRLPSLWGDGRPFPPRDEMLVSFRTRHASALSAREAWNRTFGSGSPPRELDVRDWATRGALVFAPHPDDEVIGCGGTLLDLISLGGGVTIVQVTDGSESAAFIEEPDHVRRQVRLDEAQAVAAGIGAREPILLRADNRALRATPELRDRFRLILEESQAGVAFAPSFTDIHPDHQTVLRLLADAMAGMSGARPDVALYEVWSLVAPTHVHDVSARMGRIEDLLLTYETALKIDDYVHIVAERLLFHSYEQRGSAGYLEAFEVLPADRFLELAQRHFGAAQASA